MRGHSTNPAAIEAEIAHLRSLALDALRRHWRVIFGRTPPAALSKDLLGRMITYRLQEQAFGGLDRESLRFLDGLARHGGSPRRRLKPSDEPPAQMMILFIRPFVLEAAVIIEHTYMGALASKLFGCTDCEGDGLIVARAVTVLSDP